MHHIKLFFIKTVCVYMHTINSNHIQKDLLIKNFVFITFVNFNDIFSQFFLNELESG